MHLAERTDVGLRVLITLGAHSTERLQVERIAAAHGLSFTHLQKVVRALERAGLVRTFRGRSGGVTLACAADDITIGAVVRAMEPHLEIVACFQEGESGCALQGSCSLSGLLYRARSAFFHELDETTLGDIVRTTHHPMFGAAAQLVQIGR